MQHQRLASAILLALLCAMLSPQLALATKDADRDMVGAVLSQTEKQADAFADLAKAWGKAAPGSPEAEGLALKGAEAYAALEAYVGKQLQVFEERRQWYAEQGGDYKEGRDFMEMRSIRLQRQLEAAQKLDLYKHLKK